jgi:hypothetical protein
MTREQELRHAAETGGQPAMAQLAQLLARSGREAEAAYWRRRSDEEAWAERAVRAGGRRIPAIVLVAAVLVTVLVGMAAVLSGFLFVTASRTEDDDVLVAVLVVLALGAGAVAVTMLWSVIGLLRGSEAAARRARSVASTVGVLTVAATLWILGSALLTDTSGSFMVQLVALGAAVAVPLFGLTALLGRCIPRLRVIRRA